MKSIFCAIALLCLMSAAPLPKKNRILVFMKTAGYHHESIPVGLATIIQLGKENGFSVDSTTDSTKFTSKNLKQYAAVVFLNTTGNVLNDDEQHAFESYIRAGGGFAGIHSATDTEYDWPWYGNLVGAYFGSHPSQQEAVIKVADSTSLATRHLPKEWKRKDEWYNFKWLTAEPVHMLLYIDEKSYDPGKGGMGEVHPMSWYHEFDGGRAFYTELGHTDESYSDPLYTKHLLAGIEYAMGKVKMEP